ncbi:hypothetical protein [Candidatus Nitrosocosmicus hydrocola]|uniref:hypothetical protein n=1 Tax=Candidatus Nitrosocosmicus hydrocola TaxID=1826872 RepID=UPI0013734EB1|nr:hypothetical protein [Candidatus Nitrosocosmicus hydrocola]
MVRESIKDKNNTYDKIKHLVEVDDDILAVFTIISSQIKELYIAKNSTIDSKYVDLIVNNLGYNKSTDIDISTEIIEQDAKKNLLGNLKWIVLEYDEMRILKIYESDKIIFVLINSNTQLEHTVDNILGYYYESEELPKSLF